VPHAACYGRWRALAWWPGPETGKRKVPAFYSTQHEIVVAKALKRIVWMLVAPKEAMVTVTAPICLSDLLCVYKAKQHAVVTTS